MNARHQQLRAALQRLAANPFDVSLATTVELDYRGPILTHPASGGVARTAGNLTRLPRLVVPTTTERQSQPNGGHAE